MECQDCHERDATLHFAQSVNGQKKEVHLCEQCAKERGYLSGQEDGYSLQDLLFGLFNMEPASQKTEPVSQKEPTRCPKCGMSFTEFKRIGKFGCAECYYTFSDKLDPVFRRVHSGNIRHQGKIPKRKGGSLHIKKQILGLRSELQHLIEQENFEEAAEVRDEIRALERKQTEHREAGDER
ncbi:UvrB/UvrC motif-containing protein [Aciduricibacillus chroicocephali]|uniref:UvrB/UvrC motif-containing protein n=1 Tax=Aciduricibacillus chroicocephali TaxID=3054939 RepID=A0ABY9KVY7_9BACI|nr:UvrB/UvrC motif-containing protein [Bacillaceae bacterium 44XB]